MKILVLVFASLLIAVAVSGCLTTHYPPLKTVSNVNLGKYTGRWYEIARYPHKFEKDCSAVIADYVLQKDGTISVINQCQLLSDGSKLKKAQGLAKVADKSTNAKLKVTFFWPFYGDYWILDLDEHYQYAIVGEPSRKYVWILGRTPKITNELYDKLVSKIVSFGYEKDKLIKTKHQD